MQQAIVISEKRRIKHGYTLFILVKVVLNKNIIPILDTDLLRFKLKIICITLYLVANVLLSGDESYLY